MPYANSNERRKRQRVAKRSLRAPIIAARAQRRDIVARNFLLWFRDGVESLPSSNVAWSSRLAEAMAADGVSEAYDGLEYDAYLRKLHTGAIKTPRPKTVFAIGCGLRAAGCRTASGIAALLGASYVDEASCLFDRAMTGDRLAVNRSTFLMAVLFLNATRTGEDWVRLAKVLEGLIELEQSREAKRLGSRFLLRVTDEEEGFTANREGFAACCDMLRPSEAQLWQEAFDAGFKSAGPLGLAHEVSARKTDFHDAHDLVHTLIARLASQMCERTAKQPEQTRIPPCHTQQ